MPAFNSPEHDPLDGYSAFRESVFDDVDDYDDEFIECDFCGRRASLTSPEGYPICQDCAEERADKRFQFQERE